MFYVQTKGSLMAQIPGVHVETLFNPIRYTQAQVDQACDVAHVLQRGKLVLVVEPERED